jgi:hypothetical protein
VGFACPGQLRGGTAVSDRAIRIRDGVEVRRRDPESIDNWSAPCPTNHSRINPASETQSARAATESAMLVRIWLVDPDQESAAVNRLREMLSAVSPNPGFVSGRVLGSADRESIAVLVEMRTIADRKRLEQLEPVRATLAHLDGTMNIVIRLYDEIGRYAA